MNKTLLTTAASLGLMTLSNISLAEAGCCQFVGTNTDQKHAVVFSIADEEGYIDNSYPVKPGESVAIDLPCTSQVLIGATVVENTEIPPAPVKQPCAGLLSYKGGPVQVGTQISANFPCDFEMSQ